MSDQQVQQPQMPPPNYLVWAILTTVLCCLPPGIVSIVFASQVNSKWAAGDYEGAYRASKNAKIWAWVSFGIAILSLIIWISLVAIGVIAGGILEGFNF